jgi:nitrogen fixation protein FixH
MDYEGKKIMAYQMVIMVNAKNSYGGYVGAKPYICYLAQNDKSVLRVQ